MLPESAGGALMFRREQFEAVNGYAVSYWGWGLEVRCPCPLLPARILPLKSRSRSNSYAQDDDIYYRVVGVFGSIVRLNETAGRYRSVLCPAVAHRAEFIVW